MMIKRREHRNAEFYFACARLFD